MRTVHLSPAGLPLLVALGLSLACGSSPPGGGAGPGPDGGSSEPDGGSTDAAVGRDGGGIAPDSAPAQEGGNVSGPLQLDACGKGDYCFVWPKPLGWDLGSVYVAAADDVWIAGGPGGIAHYDGKTWTQASLHSNADFVLVPRAADDIWAMAGQGADAPQLRHFDGQTWTSVALPGGQAGSIAPVGPNDAWAMISDSQSQLPVLYHWDGKAWTASSQTIAGYYATVTGTAPDDAWIYGDQSFYRLLGDTWQPATPPPMSTAGATAELLPLGANAAWFVGGQDNYAWNGMTWSSVTPASESGRYSARSPSDIWVANEYEAEHWDGTTWSTVSIPGQNSVSAIDGTTSVWGVGAFGAISELQSTGFVQANMPPTFAPTYRAVRAFADDDVVLAGTSALAHWDGTAFTAGPDVGMNDWSAADGTSSQDYFVVGATLVLDQTGIGYADTYGTAAHLVGGQETILPMPSATMPILRAVYAAAANDVWAVGDEGTIVHYDGQAWTFAAGWAPDDTKGPFTSVSGRSASDVWAAGSGATLHYDGNSWTASSDPVAMQVQSICPGQGNQEWAASANGVIHYDGSSWQAMPWPANWPSQGDPTTLSQCATGGSDAFFTSAQGFVVHWDGTTLSQELLYRGSVVDWIQGVGASPSGKLWLAFYGGELAVHQP